MNTLLMIVIVFLPIFFVAYLRIVRKNINLTYDNVKLKLSNEAIKHDNDTLKARAIINQNVRHLSDSDIDGQLHANGDFRD